MHITYQWEAGVWEVGIRHGAGCSFSYSWPGYMWKLDGRSASQWAWFQDYIIIIIIYGLLIYDNKALCNYCTHPIPADCSGVSAFLVRLSASLPLAGKSFMSGGAIGQVSQVSTWPLFVRTFIICTCTLSCM